MSQVDISPVQRLALHARFKTNAVAVIYEGHEYTYGELHELIERFAAGLVAHGVQAGDRVAYLGHNSLTFLTTFFGASWMGAIFVPLNFRLSAVEVGALLSDCEPKVIVVEPGHMAVYDTIAHDLSIHSLLVDTDASLEVPARKQPYWDSLARFTDARLPSVEPVSRVEDDVAVLMYTSGTTGKPKGAILTHGNLWWNAVNVDSVVDTRDSDINLAIAPLFHIGGLNAFTVRCLTRGATTIIRRAFDPAQALDDLVKFHVTTVFAVPAMFASIARVPGFADADLSELRAAVAAGAPVPPALISEYATHGVMVQQAWGLTETAPFATYLPASRTIEKTGSAGIAMPYTEVTLVDVETGAEITEPNRAGELWVRGPNVVREYWRNETANADAFVRGWFRTGDIGYLDDDGFVFIVDRLKDMVITGGENVYPAEVERVLASHPFILDVAVVGLADSKWGEAVTAVVCVADSYEMTLDEVREFAAEFLARYKLPSRLHVVESMPRNGAGKLDKIAIRAQFTATVAGVAS
ncbi:long-chain fatty acid--CoA ligase [soil metagenome]